MSAKLPTHLGVHSELDLLLLTESVRDVHHQSGVCLEVDGLRTLLLWKMEEASHGLVFNMDSLC